MIILSRKYQLSGHQFLFVVYSVLLLLLAALLWEYKNVLLHGDAINEIMKILMQNGGTLC